MRSILVGTQEVLVSDEDFLWLVGFTWALSGRKQRQYVYCRSSPYRDQLLHVMVARRMGLDLSNQIDHENGNQFDCRRYNLRPATGSQNQFNAKRRVDNTSGLRGVSQHTSGKWSAVIQANKRQLHLGLFRTPELAAQAYNAAAKILHGDFASEQT